MKILPQDFSSKDLYSILTRTILPRPIAFISTVNKNKIPNAAPFCFFMGVTSNPPTIAVSIMRRGNTMQKKDTIKNIESTREFVINVVDENLASAMNIASGSYPRDMSEFDVSGITPIESDIVKAPRIAESPIQMECKLNTIIDLGKIPASIVIAEVVCFHIKENVLTNGEIDFNKLKVVGRLGEGTYVKMANLFEMNQPA